MLKIGNKDSKRIIATILLICIAFANCFTLLSTLSFAEANELGRQITADSLDYIDYNVSFVEGDETKGYECEAAVDEEGLAIHIELGLNQKGYIKNGKVLVESENGLSFNIQESANVEDNKIQLSNISADEKIDLVLPIRYNQKEDIDNLNKKVNFKLFGTYVNDLGDQKEIYENVVLRLIWKTNTEYDLSSKIEKFIPYSNENNKGIIVQTLLNTEIPSSNSFVEKEEIHMDAIKLDGYEIENLSIVEKNGEELPMDKWNYDEENNKINIMLENSETTLKSQQFIITYNFIGEEKIELPFKMYSTINGSIFMFGNNENKEIEKSIEYEVSDEIGDIVTVEATSINEMKLGKLLANKVSDENKYALNYEVKLTSNISSKELVEGILIKDVGEEFENKEDKFVNENSYYKSAKISKENFEKILGTDGNIQFVDKDGNVLKEINSNTNIDDENNYKLDFDEKINQLYIKTSAPKETGNLIINIQKEINSTNYTSEELRSFDTLNIKYSSNVVYLNNVENKISDIEAKIKLVKPETRADLTISRNTLSTIAENNDVELSIKLNNTNEDVDLYKNPSFTVVFPKYIEDIEISNIAVANNEDVFNIKEANIDRNKDGKVILNIKLEGTQKEYNSNYLTNGTNILLKANIKLNIYTPIGEDKITMEYSNENATTYANGKAYSEVVVTYKAPMGMVSVNEISNYDKNGKSIVSVEQGKITDKIEIFDDAKKAKMDILVMNNNQNNCTGIKILGRIPFKGNKNVVTGEDLGTTLDTKLISSIVGDAKNSVDSTVYYSSNGEATDDLTNPQNQWTLEPENLSQVKSYLIVPNDYEMKLGEILRYSYTFEIPANLEHNTYIYGSFATVYTNMTEIASVKEVSCPDLVGLTTGTGTQIKAEISSNVKENVKEYEKVKYTVYVENTGTDLAEDVKIRVPIPTGATLATNSTQKTVEVARGWSLKSDREYTKTIEQIKPGEKQKIEFYVQINKLPSIEEYYANKEGFTKNNDGTYSIIDTYKDENGETKTTETVISNLPTIKIASEAIITAKELAKELVVKSDELVVEKADIVAEETVTTEEDIAKVNETIEAQIEIKNNSNNAMQNIVVKKVLPEGLNFSESYIRGYQQDGLTLKKLSANDYNPDTKTITWTIDKLGPGKSTIVIGKLVIADMKDNVYQDTLSTYSTITVNGQNYQAGQVDIKIGRPNLIVKQVSNNKNEFIKVGDEIQYIFDIQNKGAVKANDVALEDFLPKEVEIKKLVYTVDGAEISKVVAQNEDATVYGSIEPGNTMNVKITAKVGDINLKQKEIKNVAEITASNTGKIKSNTLVNTIERTSNSVVTENIANEENTTSKVQSIQQNATKQELKTTYSIKGTAWLDENANGIRDNAENRLPGIKVKLINIETNKAVSQDVTDINGVYEFKNLENGKYIAVFYFDNTRYGLTDYKKQNVAENENSDVIATIEETQNVATTDTIVIKNGSQSNIDIGLTTAKTFDLSLDKTVSKVTVQTRDDTKTYDYNNEKLAKVDINGKYLRDAIVYVEYSFTIKNEGEVAGYAKNIVDYLPSGLEFSTELNKNWYKGTDGKLYTTELENDEIQQGESRTIKLVLTKKMTEENTGIVNNQAEIYQTFNKLGISDKDLINNEENNNQSSADLIIGVQTGDTLIHISIIIITLIVTLIALFIINKSKIITKIQMRIEKEV